MTKINYYISINGYQISCGCGDDKNKAISFFNVIKNNSKPHTEIYQGLR